jgi:hypothetical protein
MLLESIPRGARVEGLISDTLTWFHTSNKVEGKEKKGNVYDYINRSRARLRGRPCGILGRVRGCQESEMD